MAHCQYQNKKVLFTDPIFSEGFESYKKKPNWQNIPKMDTINKLDLTCARKLSGSSPPTSKDQRLHGRIVALRSAGNTTVNAPL